MLIGCGKCFRISHAIRPLPVSLRIESVPAPLEHIAVQATEAKRVALGDLVHRMRLAAGVGYKPAHFGQGGLGIAVVVVGFGARAAGLFPLGFGGQAGVRDPLRETFPLGEPIAEGAGFVPVHLLHRTTHAFEMAWVRIPP